MFPVYRWEAHLSALSRQVAATSPRKQRVQAEVIDANSNVLNSTTLYGEQKESLYLEDDSTKNTIVWGPFDALTTVELSFSSLDSDTGDWEPSSVESDKIKEASSILLSVEALQWRVAVAFYQRSSDSDYIGMPSIVHW